MEIKEINPIEDYDMSESLISKKKFCSKLKLLLLVLITSIIILIIYFIIIISLIRKENEKKFNQNLNLSQNLFHQNQKMKL